MRLGIETNGANNELAMQSEFEDWIQEHNDRFKDSYAYKEKVISYSREVTVNQVGRRADFLIFMDNKLINIELKTNPNRTLMDQLLSHKKYCDYCFALVPDFCLIPRWFINELVKNGFGLIMYNRQKKIFTESLPAFYNKPEMKGVRKAQISKLSEKTLF